MLDVRCPNELKAASLFAAKLPDPRSNRSLHENLSWLTEWHQADCVLYRDHAPYSFGFALYRLRKYWGEWKRETDPFLVGGLIYTGPEAPGDGSFPALTVDNSGIAYPHWGLHT